MSWPAGTTHLAVAAMVLKPLTLLQAGSHSSFLSLLITTSALLAAYLVSSALYALTLHPLARFPGPRLCALSRLPFWYACITGHQVQWMHALHMRYGPVVRYSPNDLSFVDEGNSPPGSAWRSIHGQEKGEAEFPKAKEWFVAPENGIYGINSAASHANHRRYRRLFRPAFSSSALRAQEPLFQKHVSALLAVLSSAAATTVPGTAGSVPIDILELLNFTTFDIMGDLTLSQPLGLLASRAYTPWVTAVFASLRVIPLAQVIQYYPLLSALFRLVEPKVVKEMKYRHFRHSADRVDARLGRRDEGPLNDIWEMVLKAGGAEEGDDPLSLEEMYTHADVFMLAGSETTGTAMAGLVYLLLKNPDKMEKVKQEVRGAFPNGVQEVTMERAAARLGYLDACIQEALRMYPPVPVGVPREVPRPGKEILSRWVAPGTRVSVHHYATYRSPASFDEPDRFLPERHLAGAGGGDRREALQPFGFGPRGCIGQNMAMNEMRLIMACLLLRFDLELCDPDVDWLDQRAFVLWEKRPLMCRVREAVV